jgi:Flp pilus assembly pilin Flp
MMALIKISPFSREVGILPGGVMLKRACKLWNDEQGQDIAEYAVMLAVILVLVVGTVRLIGSNANNAFSAVASSIQ